LGRPWLRYSFAADTAVGGTAVDAVTRDFQGTLGPQSEADAVAYSKHIDHRHMSLLGDRDLRSVECSAEFTSVEQVWKHFQCQTRLTAKVIYTRATIA
jgi:hypothetical protein